jgi:hypothetical protein
VRQDGLSAMHAPKGADNQGQRVAVKGETETESES